MAEFIEIGKFAGEFTDEARLMKNGKLDPEIFKTKWADELKKFSENTGGGEIKINDV